MKYHYIWMAVDPFIHFLVGWPATFWETFHSAKIFIRVTSCWCSVEMMYPEYLFSRSASRYWRDAFPLVAFYVPFDKYCFSSELMKFVWRYCGSYSPQASRLDSVFFSFTFRHRWHRNSERRGRLKEEEKKWLRHT